MLQLRNVKVSYDGFLLFPKSILMYAQGVLLRSLAAMETENQQH